MSRKIYLTEAQFNALLEASILEESTNNLIYKVKIGAILASAAIGSLMAMKNMNDEQKTNVELKIAEVAPVEQWRFVTDSLIVTVYNAKPSQCNNDFGHTSSMFNLDLYNVGAHRIIAMERTFKESLGLEWGDVVKIEGTYQGKQDGIYQVQDLMNKRFKGQKKIDVLVPENIKFGGTQKGTFAKLYILNNKADTYQFTNNMLPQISRAENAKQMKQKRQEWKNVQKAKKIKNKNKIRKKI